MIRRSTDIPSLLRRLDADPIGNIYPRAMLQGYPANDAFYRAFESENGIILSTGSTAYLSGCFDPEELDHFLAMLGTQEIISPQPNGNKHILVYRGKKESSTACYALESELRAIWQLLCDNFHNMPDYDEFYQTKTAQRLYLGGRTGAIYDGTCLASTASVLVTASDYALLGAVATHSACRKRGHAGNILRLLIGDLLDNQKTPIILCDNPVAIHLYRGMGFEEYGKMTVRPYVLQ